MDPATEEVRRTDFVHEQRLAWDRSQRTASFVAGSVVLMLAVPLVLLAPGAEEATGMSFVTTMVADVVIVLTILITTAAYRWRGPLSALYVVLELLETAVMQCCIGYVIASSGDAANFYWFFYIAHVLVSSIRPGSDWRRSLLFLGTPAVVVFWFLANDQTANVLFPLSAGATGMLLYWFGADLQRRVTEHGFARTESEAALAKLEIAADRARIARDLHDGLAADLTAMAWRAEALALRKNVESGDILQLSARARAAIDDARNVVWAVEGKPQRWHVLCDQIEARCIQLRALEDGMSFNLDRKDSAEVDGVAALNILRVVQELVRNAAQHAEAEQICVHLSRDELAVRVEVRDDGVWHRSSERVGSGLANIRRRVEHHRGDLTIASDDEGTRVRITIPTERVEV